MEAAARKEPIKAHEVASWYELDRALFRLGLVPVLEYVDRVWTVTVNGNAIGAGLAQGIAFRQALRWASARVGA